MIESAFPVGASIAEGRWQVTEELYGGVDRGILRAGGDCPALVTIGTRQNTELAEIASRLALVIPGIAPLLWVGTIEGDGIPYDVLVEAEPAGVPLHQWSGDFNTKLRLAAQLASALFEVRAHSAALGCLRPELVYAGGDKLTGIAPRSGPFHANMAPVCYGVAPCFEDIYLSPAQAAGRELERKSDEFLLGATLAFLFTGEYPFNGDSPMGKLMAIMEGQHRSLEKTGPLAPLLRGMLDPDPRARISIEAVKSTLDEMIHAAETR